uniref:t-SNARE coiled-coil homology domain-containing protein n=2 Tax=Lotus japonicus TaxID=34305 RepID=I3S924_LOTJA|nr:unknown [Lotus japonicus]
MQLHQVFLDMTVLVQYQGEQLDNIESHVNRASSFVHTGTEQLQTARKHQKNTRKWTCFCILLLLVIILVVVLVTVKPWESNGSGGNNGGSQPAPAQTTPSPPPPPSA